MQWLLFCWLWFGFFHFKVIKTMQKLCCTTPESEHNAKGICIEVGQVRAYRDARTAGAELKHSQGWHSSHLYCPEQILNTLHLLCLGFLCKGATSKGSAGAKLSHQVSKVLGQAKLAPWRHCGFVYIAKLETGHEAGCWHAIYVPLSCYKSSLNSFCLCQLELSLQCLGMDWGQHRPRTIPVGSSDVACSFALERGKKFSHSDAIFYVSWL